MGRPDQFAKALFADETTTVTAGALRWQTATELSLAYVVPDGLLVVEDATVAARLPAPWSLARGSHSVVVDFKMQGDHVDLVAFERALHRRLSWVMKLHNDREPEPGWVDLWVAHSHLPASLMKVCEVSELSEGCYRLHHPHYGDGLWIAANELPLSDALLPWLVLRSGDRLRQFVDWSQQRRPVEWVLNLLKIIPMEYKHLKELERQLRENPDPEVQAREQMLAEIFLAGMTPEQRLAKLTPEQRLAGLAPEQRLAGLAPEQRLAGLAPEQRLAGLAPEQVAATLPVELTALGEARRAVVRVMERRGLAPSESQRQQVMECSDLAQLDRWLDQAITATSATDALS